MKKEPLISIIVPIYNVKEYLNRCIDSILNQSYHNLEIILVDDGSTDGSGKIIDSYSVSDKRIVIIHKKNGGLSDARNFGIEIATGEYFLFVDSDDWISKEYVETLLMLALKYDSDLVIGKIRKTFGNKVINDKQMILCEEKSKEETLKKILLQDGIDVSACAKLYSRNIFKQIRYPKGKLYEDFYIFGDIIESANKILITSYSGYYYFIRSGSIMQSSFNSNRLVLVEKAEEYVNYFDEHYPNLHIPAMRRYIVSVFGVLSTSVLDDSNKKCSKNLRKKVLKHKRLIFLNKNFSFRLKFQTFVIMLGILPYKIMVMFNKKIKKMKGE